MTANKANATTTVTITLPTATDLRLGEPREVVASIDWAKLAKHPGMMADLLVGGAKIILVNSYNSGGKDKTPTEKTAQLRKRLDAWERGEYVIVERESAYGAMREAYVDERRATTGASVADVEKAITATVKAAFGDKAKATFTAFLDAVAQQLFARDKEANGEPTKTPAEYRAAIEAKYQKLADEAAKRRAASKAKVDVAGIDLGDFLK